MNTACLVPDWPDAAALIQPHLTAANAGLAKGNHAGHQPTVFPRYCRQRVQISPILPSLLTRPHVRANNRTNPMMPRMGWCAVFFMDNRAVFVYAEHMLNGIRIYSADTVWRRILSDLNATVLDSPDVTAVDFDALNIPPRATAMELKAAILAAMDNSNIIRNVFGRDVALPRLQRQIVVLLTQTGGMTAAQLKVALGYSPNAATHTVDTAIYQLRRTFGRELIQNNNGVYKIGRI